MIMRDSILHNNTDIKNIDEIDKLIMDVFLLQIKCKRGGVYVQKEKLDQGRNKETGSVQEESQESKDVYESIRKKSDEEEKQSIPEDEETGSFSVNLDENEKVITKKYDY